MCNIRAILPLYSNLILVFRILQYRLAQAMSTTAGTRFQKIVVHYEKLIVPENNLFN